MNTLFVDPLGACCREAAPNSRTSAMKPVLVVGDFRSSFVRHYATFAQRLRAVEEPTLAVVAIDEEKGRVAGMMRIAARPDRVVSATIGRHGCTDLFVDAPDDLSLRHLAVLVEPARTWQKLSSDVAYRIVDLRTGAGFFDEHGIPLVSVRCEGTAFFRFGTLTFLFLAVGDPTDWPESAEDAWAMIPERVMFDERARGSIRRPESRLAEGSGLSRIMGGPGSTMVISLPPPRDLDRYDRGEPLVGSLQVECNGQAEAFEVGSSSLYDGILIGRYDRCDSAPIIADDSVSRTHLLVISVSGRVYALDTGSTNGTLRAGARVRIVELVDECILQLGANTRVRWRPGRT